MRGDIKLERIILTYNGQVLAGDYTFNPSRYIYEVSITLAGAKKKDGGSSTCLLYTSPSPRDLSTSRMPSSA